jgi:ribosomal protein RSM22 (predicted rRNA methylase)
MARRLRHRPDFEPDAIDWDRLRELRDGFLDAGGGARGAYWLDAEDVALYDATFGRRIAWKWDAVLDELVARGFALPAGRWLDWGAGSAIATRAVLARAPGAKLERITLVDHSRAALEFARDAIVRERPALEVELAEHAGSDPVDFVLVSHVMSELSGAALDELVATLRAARAFVWVESAAQEGSRALSAVRERLLDALDPVAPCPHRERCGVLAAGRERDWCHFFAAPPAHVFTSREWAAFGRELSIDLRSLPYSFLAMRERRRAARESAAESSAVRQLDPLADASARELAARAVEPSVVARGELERRGGVPSASAVHSPSREHGEHASSASRLLGRARVERAALHLQCCEAPGVCERRLLRRHDGKLFNRLSEIRQAPKLVRWRLAGGEIVGVDETLA